jgi:hypothetical protein
MTKIDTGRVLSPVTVGVVGDSRRTGHGPAFVPKGPAMQFASVRVITGDVACLAGFYE